MKESLRKCYLNSYLTVVDLISGSSMPIRDVDTFFRKTTKDITIFANRGTNGIDGVVSTAFGIQAARKRPTWLLIGDLSFLHDVNGLIVSRFHETDLTIVIVNNDGGGIFSYLPTINCDRIILKSYSALRQV